MKKVVSIFVLILMLTAISSAQTPQFYNYATGGGANSFPFGIAGGKMVQWLVLPGEWTGASADKQISNFYVRIATGYPINGVTYSQFYIRMGQTTITSMTSGTFYSGTMDTVYKKASVTLTAAADTWLKFVLDRPFIYNPAQGVVIEIGHCGAPGATGFPLAHTTVTGNRRIWSVGGCPFAPYASAGTNVLNCGIDLEPIPVLYYNYMTGGGANSFPFGIAGGKMVQWLVLAQEFTNPTSAPLGLASKLAVRIATGYPINNVTYYTFRILIGQSTISGLTSGTFYSGAMDTIYKRDTITLSAAADSWLEFPFDHSFVYNPAQSLIIQIGHCGAPSATGFPLAHTTVTGNRRVWSIGGCPFAPYASAGTNVLNCGLYLVSLTGATPITTQVPKEYRLEQNYPNPFNPLTKISFDIPKTGFVSLKIYDILGKELKVLVNEVKNAGRYSVEFDGSAFASGTYFYRLESGGFISTKKMILIK